MGTIIMWFCAIAGGLNLLVYLRTGDTIPFLAGAVGIFTAMVLYFTLP